MTTTYIIYGCTAPTPCFMTKEQAEEVDRTWLCTGCMGAKPGVKAVDIHIENRRPQGMLNFVAAGIGLARRSFLMQFGEERVSKYLYLGRVFSNGREIDDWVTYRGRYGLVVRGTEHVGYRVCEKCGRYCYFALCRPHFWPPRPEVELFQGHDRSLIVPEHVASECNIAKHRYVHVARGEVVERPLDGIEIDMSWES